MKEKARAFAEKAHQGQYRKITKTPYITHPIRVGEILEEAGCSDELISAGYLHDVVEDTQYEIEDIEELFGTKIAEFVASHTEDKSKTWKERKQHTINILRDADKEVKYLIVADRLDNIMEFEKDLHELGSKVWGYFNAGYEDQKWYNESMIKNMSVGLNRDDIPSFFTTFEQTVLRVFRKENQ